MVGAHRAIALLDCVYRRWHHLDAPPSKVPPLLSISARRAWRPHRLADGTMLRWGDPYGELHLDNAAVVALRQQGLSSVKVGLKFRHELHASLVMLARLSNVDERFAGLAAFSAITIFHQGLVRLGFEVETDGLIIPRVTGAYQHALLLSLGARPGLHRSPCARRLWISRCRLHDLYGHSVAPRDPRGHGRPAVSAHPDGSVAAHTFAGMERGGQRRPQTLLVVEQSEQRLRLAGPLGAIADGAQRLEQTVALGALRQEGRQDRASGHGVSEDDATTDRFELPVAPAVAEQVVATVTGQAPGEVAAVVVGIVVDVEAERERPDADDVADERVVAGGLQHRGADDARIEAAVPGVVDQHPPHRLRGGMDQRQGGAALADGGPIAGRQNVEEQDLPLLQPIALVGREIGRVEGECGTHAEE